MSVNKEPKNPVRFTIEMVLLLTVPPLAMGLFIAAVSGTENGIHGFALGTIIGVGAASLRNEIRGMRSAD